MKYFFIEVELINAVDLSLYRNKIISKDDIGSMYVNIALDRVSNYVYINKSVQQQLGLCIVEKRKGKLNDGSIAEYDVAGPIKVRCNNRRCVMDAIITPEKNELRLGINRFGDIIAGIPSVKSLATS